MTEPEESKRFDPAKVGGSPLPPNTGFPPAEQRFNPAIGAQNSEQPSEE